MRASVRDITLNEGTTGRDLDYQGLELPILTDQELLEQTWNLEDQPEENAASNAEGVPMDYAAMEDNGKRGREEDDDGVATSKRKKARVEDAMQQQEEETFNVAVEPPEVPAAPLRHGEVPDVVVTPAVTELPKRRTSPQQLNLDEAEADPEHLLPDPIVQNPDEVQDHVPQDVAQAGEPDAEFLQPLVPAAPLKAGRGKKKTNIGAQVDEVMQLRAQDIRVRPMLIVDH